MCLSEKDGEDCNEILMRFMYWSTIVEQGLNLNNSKFESDAELWVKPLTNLLNNKALSLSSVILVEN